MIKPGRPDNEEERLEALSSYRLWKATPDPEYNDLVQLASEICSAPISMITLINQDEQWFVASRGLEGVEGTSRDNSICGHALLEPGRALIIPDLAADERFIGNPVVENRKSPLRFYAGVTLNTKEGYPLGTLCVMDHQPRQLEEQQQIALRTLARQAMNLIELRRTNRFIEEKNNQLARQNRELNQFAYIVSHDLTTPIRAIREFTQIILEEETMNLSETGRTYGAYLEESSQRLFNLMKGMAKYVRLTNRLYLENSNIKQLVEKVVKDNCADEIQASGAVIKNDIPDIQLTVCRHMFEDVFIQLISNAILFQHPDRDPLIEITYKEESGREVFCVKDNGRGIPKKFRGEAFTIFRKMDVEDDLTHVGLGLAIVKKIVELHEGEVWLKSKVNKGTSIYFALPQKKKTND